MTPQSACEPSALAQWMDLPSLLLLRQMRRSVDPQDRQDWSRLKVKFGPS